MKNFARNFVPTIFALALGSLHFAQEQIGGGAAQQAAASNLGETEYPEYPFAQDLRTMIIDEIQASKDVNLSDSAVDKLEVMDDSSPAYALANSITNRFAKFLETHGVTPETFEWEPTEVEGKDETADLGGESGVQV